MKTLQEQIIYDQQDGLTVNSILQFNYNTLNEVIFRATILTSTEIKPIEFTGSLVALFTIKRKFI